MCSARTKSILVVGAGFAGATYARVLAECGFRVTVIDKRSHIAGNAFDYVDQNGIRIHKYGPHLFHTSNKEVFEWVSRFTGWAPYEHKVRALTPKGLEVPLPINRETVNSLFSKSLRTAEEVQLFLSSISEKITDPKNAGEYLRGNIGNELTDLFFRPYTRKMWGHELEDMSPDVVKRIPIRFDDEDRYFPNDIFQAMPRDGYTSLFDNLLNHEHISVHLNRPFQKQDEQEYQHVFSSMPIDEYHEFCLGHLPYRSIRFHNETRSQKRSTPWSVINYTDSGKFTRETHWHLLPNHLVNDTGRYTVTKEEPCNYLDNNLERYYPIKSSDGINEAIYAKYKLLSLSKKTVSFIGRCGTYQYLDMHQVINQSLAGVRKWVFANRDL